MKSKNFQISSWAPIKCAVNLLGMHMPAEKSVLVKTNFDMKFNKVYQILQDWKDKYLSIYSKVTIINSLIVLQFTYCLLSLSSPDMIFFKAYEKKSFDSFGMINQKKLSAVICMMHVKIVV